MNHYIKPRILAVAQDVEVQRCVLNAMFQGCERGTDLWEYLEGDSQKFAPATHLLLWGSYFPTSDDDDDDIDDDGEGANYVHCLYNDQPCTEVIEALIDEVERIISIKLV